MKCNSCSAELIQDSCFCNFCGNAVNQQNNIDNQIDINNTPTPQNNSTNPWDNNNNVSNNTPIAVNPNIKKQSRGFLFIILPISVIFIPIAAVIGVVFGCMQVFQPDRIEHISITQEITMTSARHLSSINEWHIRLNGEIKNNFDKDLSVSYKIEFYHNDTLMHIKDGSRFMKSNESYSFRSPTISITGNSNMQPNRIEFTILHAYRW